MEKTKKDVSYLLKESRKLAKMSQRELADKLNLTCQTVCAAENNYKRTLNSISMIQWFYVTGAFENKNITKKLYKICRTAK